MELEALGDELMVRLLFARLTPEPVNVAVAVEALLALDGKVNFSLKLPNATGAKTADTLHQKPEAIAEVTEHPFVVDGDT